MSRNGPSSGDRVPHRGGYLEVVHAGVGAVVLRELDAELRPTGRSVPAVTPEGWTAMAAEARRVATGAAYARVDLESLGRSLCHRAGQPDQLVIIARDGGYDCTSAGGMCCYTEAEIGPFLRAAGRMVPSAEDLRWLRGEVDGG